MSGQSIPDLDVAGVLHERKARCMLDKVAAVAYWWRDVLIDSNAAS